jgi:hypothetical protein
MALKPLLYLLGDSSLGMFQRAGRVLALLAW